MYQTLLISYLIAILAPRPVTVPFCGTAPRVTANTTVLLMHSKASCVSSSLRCNR